MIRQLLALTVFFISFIIQLKAQTAIQTSFESPDYSLGNLHNQNIWTVTNGNVVISAEKTKTGLQSIKLNANNGALLTNYIAYAGNTTGLRGEVYADMWINPTSFVTKGIAINGFDLYGGSSKRLFVIEFTTDNKIKAYNGSSGSNVGVWATNEWVRISVKLDIEAEKYKVAINGVVSETEFNLRESYAPTASGSRVANIKEFHSLRINHTSDTQVATSEAYIDDIYIGTNPIADVSFGASSTLRTITVTEPEYGTIVLNPNKPEYHLDDEVTATLILPNGYKNNGWTGSLSGTELTKSFIVTGNMAIGANVSVDLTNPPPQYTVTVNVPVNGTIVLNPSSADGKYYEGEKVTATISYEACYQFNEWMGHLSGNQQSKLFTVNSNMEIGADISENTTPSVKRVVNTVNAFKSALSAMNPGDTIQVADGAYNLSGVTITRSGCSNKPIIIIAENEGQAVLNGSTALVLESVKHITIKGFVFQSASIGTGIKLQNSSRIRITKNRFSISETTSCNWIYIGDTYGSTIPLRSGHNRIDYNVFDGKTQPGKYIIIDGNASQQSQHDTISYNIFKNNGPRAANEKESIRVGVSTLSKSSGFTVIEYNLFEDCDGDPEVVSIKSCDNIIRYNTFRRCLGTLSLRHGDRSIVEGNYFFGEGKTANYTDPSSVNTSVIGCGGIRVYGLDHKIINNYFEGLTGSKWDAAITITNGDVLNTSTSLSSHFIPENVIVAFNTFVANESNIEIGFDNGAKYNRAPKNCMIANNIVIENKNPIVKSYSSASLAGVSFSNNIMYPTGTSSIGITANLSEIKNIDPKLIKPACTGADCEQQQAAKVMRLSADSPAIDAAEGDFSYIQSDFEGVVRNGAKDIGAHEYSGARTATISALSENYVGPAAVPLEYSYNYSGTLPVKLISFKAYAALKDVKLEWKTAEEKNVSAYLLEWKSDKGEFFPIANREAESSEVYTCLHQNSVTGNNYYRLKIIGADGTFEYSSIINFKRGYETRIFPNPAKTFVNVWSGYDMSGKAEWQLVNTLGVVVRKQTTGISVQRINLSGLSSGLYYLHFYVDEKRVSVHPLIVE